MALALGTAAVVLLALLWELSRPRLTEALAQRFDEETVLKVLGGNFLRVFEAVCG